MTTPKDGLTRIILTTIKETAAPPTHAARLAAGRKAVTEADAAFKAAGHGLKRFLATYRLASATSPTKGTYDERREHLITRIKALNGVQHHVSTSAWSTRSYHQTREEVLKALRPAIDEAMDFLQVEQTAEPISVGVAKLKS
jgi:hypothetical protein